MKFLIFRVKWPNLGIAYSLVRASSKYLVPSWLGFDGATLTGTPGSNRHQTIRLLVKGKDAFGGIGEVLILRTTQNCYLPT